MFPAKATSLGRKNLPKICPNLLLRTQRCFSNVCEEEKEKSANRIEFKDEHFTPPKKGYQWESVWERPKCCKPPCDVLRHDILYLKETPKKYTRTWAECTEFQKERYICEGEIEPPEIEHRTHKAKVVKVANVRCKGCDGDEGRLGLMKCQPPVALVGLCPKLRMPGCPEPRDPPTCEKFVKHKCCQKRCTMYPSYSECQRDKPKVPCPTECKCLKIPSTCEVYELFRKFHIK